MWIKHVFFNKVVFTISHCRVKHIIAIIDDISTLCQQYKYIVSQDILYLQHNVTFNIYYFWELPVLCLFNAF